MTDKAIRFPSIIKQTTTKPLSGMEQIPQKRGAFHAAIFLFGACATHLQQTWNHFKNKEVDFAKERNSPNIQKI